MKTEAERNEWREVQNPKPAHMETQFEVKKVGLHTPPSYANNLPLKGWHRHIVLRGEIIGPHDRVVCHWPPFDPISEDPTRRKLLRSKAEVAEWLACCNAQLYLDRFSFDVQDCLSQWPSDEDGLILTKNRGKLPVLLGQLPPQRSGPHNNDKAKFEEQEIFVANSLGFPIDRYFEYVDEATFRWTHHEFLKTLRHSVRDDIARQCREEKEKRQNVDKLFEREKRLCFRHALFAKHGRAIDDEDGEDKSLAVESTFVTMDGMNLLYHCASTHAKSELFELSPHIAEVTSNVFQFPLLNEDYCSHLASVARQFRAKARQHCSHLPGDTARVPARICLDKLGLSEEVASELIKRVARPLAARLFPGIGETLDHHVAFFDTRAETMRQQQPMDAPVFNENRGEEIFDNKLEDEAEVVLDICLESKSVEGFLPSRCFHGTDEEPIHPSVEVSHHQVGSALLYDGTMRHSRVVGGPEQLHLVIWCRSMPFRELNSYEGGEDYRNYGSLAHEYNEAGVPGPAYSNYDGEEEGGVYLDGEERIYVEKDKPPFRLERPRRKVVEIKGYDEVGPLPYDPQNPPPEFRRTFFDEGHTREDLYMPTPRERENFKEFWREKNEELQRKAVNGTLRPDEDILGALLERADEEGGVQGVQYIQRSVPLKPGEKVNEEPPKVRFDQEDDFDNRFGEGLKFGEY